MGNEVAIKITASGGSAAAAEINKGKDAGNQLGHTISGIGSTARGLLAADFIGEIGAKARESFHGATDAASNLNESLNAVDKIFGASAKQIHDWGANNANAFGLSERAFNEMATPLGASLKNAGIEMGKVSDMTIMLTKRAADMASVFNTSVQGALEDIQAALRGEADPIEKYGVSMQAAAVTAEALAMSGKKVESELTLQDKALARVNLIMRQTESTAGDFKDTSDGLANSTRIANAQLEEAKAKLGQGLLPVLAEGAKLLGGVAEGFSKLPGPVQTTAAVVFGLGAAFVFLAPKILAARDAMKEIDVSWARSDTKLGGAVRTVGHFAGRLAALTTAAQIAGAAFSKDLNPQIEELAENLSEYAQTTKVAGEASRLFDDDLSRFGRDARVLNKGFWDDAAKGIGKFFEDWSGMSNVATSSIRNSEERIRAIDAALAHLVEQGRGDEAQQIFEKLAEQAKETGVSVDELRSGLPQYAAAQNAAGRATAATTHELEGQVIQLGELEKALRAQTDPVFALIQAQNDLTEAQKNYNDAVKEHGKNSPEAAAALRDMAVAAITLTGAVNDAQGVFTGQLTPAMKQTLIQAGFTTAQIKALEDQFKTAAAAGDAFAKTYNATINVNYRDPGRSNQGHRQELLDMGRASGGPGSGQMIVGEYGHPEIVDFDARRVLNPSQTQQALNAGGMGNGQLDVVITFNVNGAEREMSQLIKKLVDTEGGGDVVKAFSRSRAQR